MIRQLLNILLRRSLITAVQATTETAATAAVKSFVQRFDVRLPTTIYVRASQCDVTVYRQPGSQVELSANLRASFGWDFIAEHDDLGVYIVAKRKPVVGAISTAKMMLIVPPEAHLMFHLTPGTVHLMDVEGKLRVPGNHQSGMTKQSPDLFTRFFVAMQFERAGVFEIVKRRYDCNTVLYPGCFVHLTPSFYFPHVVYVDRSDDAQEFFADTESLLERVSRRKTYKRSPFIRFIAQDYTRPLPVMEKSFDLLLSLYAPGISRSCQKYLRVGGHLLTNDHRGDAAEAAADETFDLVAVVHEKGSTYKLAEGDLDQYFVRRQATRGVNSRYTKTADYYLFRKSLGK